MGAFSYTSRGELGARVARLLQEGNGRVELGPEGRSIQFIRSVGARSSQILPAFYHLNAGHLGDGLPANPSDYPSRLFFSYAGDAAQSVVGLICRNVFEPRRQWSGNDFARHKPSVREGHATFWAKHSGVPVEVTRSALALLQKVFADVAKPSIQALGSGSTLAKRAALVNLYASRSAAHISLDDYCYAQEDMAHVVAAIVIMGAIIARFDSPWLPRSYFDDLDMGSWISAKRLFPGVELERLFGSTSVPELVDKLLAQDSAISCLWIAEQLPMAIGLAQVAHSQSGQEGR